MYIAKTINKCTFASKLINRLLKYLSLVFMIYSCMDTFNKVTKTITMGTLLTIDIHCKANTTDIM